MNTETLEGQLWYITRQRADGRIPPYQNGDRIFRLYISKNIHKSMTLTDPNFEFLEFSSEYHSGLEPTTQTGISLISHQKLATTHGLSFYGNGQGGNQLLHLPFADGTFNGSIQTDSDFKVMSGAICRAIQGVGFCGTLTNNPWGY